MKTSRIVIAALIVSLFALPAAFAKPTIAHGTTVRGTIANLNETGKSFDVQEKSGKNVDLIWTAATKVNHGPLKDGENATVRYMKRDGKNVATVINIAPPPAAKTSAKAPAKATTSSASMKTTTATTAKH